MDNRIKTIIARLKGCNDAVGNTIVCCGSIATRVFTDDKGSTLVTQHLKVVSEKPQLPQDIERLSSCLIETAGVLIPWLVQAEDEIDRMAARINFLEDRLAEADIASNTLDPPEEGTITKESWICSVCGCKHDGPQYYLRPDANGKPVCWDCNNA
jgi:hypothetical protein